MDRITRVRIKNVRAIEYVDLEVSAFTVLIGENGSCKSTIVECMELLRKAAEPSFFKHLYNMHRGMQGLLRKGATALELGVVIEDDEGKQPQVEYSFALMKQDAGAVVHSERLEIGPMSKAEKPRVALRRTAAQGEMFDQTEGKVVPIPADAMRPDQLVIGSFGSLPPQKALERLLRVLRGMEVHLHFDTVAVWAARSYQLSQALRGASYLQPTDRLALLGFNFSNAWAALKSKPTAHWNRTMSLVRLGLGDAIDTVNTDPDAGGGNVAVSVVRTDIADPIPAANLSDGQLAWLAFVAMVRLNEGRSMLVIDEPELHLHPYLLGGVVTLLKGVNSPVVVATQSDRVLELLDDPASAVRVCALEEGGIATLARVDPAELSKWVEHFGDFGRLRAAGYLSRVLQPAPTAPDEEDE